MTRSAMAGDSPDTSISPPSTSPNKRLKTLVPKLKSKEQLERSDDQFELQQQEPSMEEEPGSVVCGICLSDGGNSISGRIDSCDHYFCFVCIMEWAKVESRCPMCKRRFTSICRPPKHGVFACERVVDVPQRDQVYLLFGNATTTISNPYAETRCTVCHSMANESLLLLCDLCDSAAHTYCVGLGHTVPEGDWFCYDCAVSRAEHEKAELDRTESKLTHEESGVSSQADPHVSIFDIVQESNGSSLTRLTSLSTHLSRPISSINQSSIADEETRVATRTGQRLVHEATQSCARTLRRCRYVHNRIETLRENWNALRNGSLKFSSSSGESCGESSKKHNGGSECTFSSSNKPSTAENGGLCLAGEKRDPYDTDKAWKMMKMAKSVKQDAGKSSGGSRVLKAFTWKGKAREQSSKIRSSVCLSEKQQVGAWSLGSPVILKQSKHTLLDHEKDKQGLQKSEKQKHKMGLSRWSVKFNMELPSSSLQFHQFPLPREVQMQTAVCGAGLPAKTMHRISSSETNLQNGSSCLAKSVESTPEASDPSRGKREFSASSSSKVPVPEGKLRSGKSSTEKQARQSDDAKTEIQSLVKLNLKLLSKGKKLGVDAFKEIARLSTHTILAACVLEHPKPGIRSFPSSICNHTSQIQQLRRSTLMPNSCRECFYAFVRDVVQSVCLEKASHDRSS